MVQSVHYNGVKCFKSRIFLSNTIALLDEAAKKFGCRTPTSKLLGCPDNHDTHSGSYD